MNRLFIFILFPFIVTDFARRLPKSVVPVEYDLKLKIPLNQTNPEENIFFNGSVSINLKIIEPTDRITLHTKYLDLIDQNFHVFNGTENLSIISIDNNAPIEQTTFIVNRSLKPSDHITLNIVYIGKFSDDLNGLFLSDYTDENGVVRHIIASQSFPKVHKILPCFNEPWMKAIWNVEVTHPTGYFALSNSLDKTTIVSESDNTQTTTFHPTPIMSPYILAITISDYANYSNWLPSGTLLRVFAPKHMLDKTLYPTSVTSTTLSRLEIIFGINYTLPKLDFFPVKTMDKNTGAMENWGLVIYHEQALFDDIYTVETIVIHELVHQWFGNLVTMDWYTDYWLNEGFARMYDEDITLKTETRFGYKYLAYHKYTRSINEHPIRKQDFEITPDFEFAVVYEKAAALLRMLHKLVGSWQYRRQISKYLQDNSFKSTNASILCSYFANSMPIGSPSVYDFMDSWLDQVGIPSVVFKNFNDTHYELTQKRFDNGVLDELDEKLPTPKWNYTWFIPIWYCYTKNQKNEQLMWLRPGESGYISKNATTEGRGLWVKKVVS